MALLDMANKSRVKSSGEKTGLEISMQSCWGIDEI